MNFRYYYCSAIDANGIKLSCPDQYAFDPRLPDTFPCRYTRNRAADCITVSKDCKDSTEVLKYPSMTAALGQISVECIANGKIMIVNKCGPYTSFDSNAGACVGSCTTDSQKFADSSDRNAYKVCARNAAGNGFVMLDRNCPKGHVFNAKTNECHFEVSNEVAVRIITETMCSTETPTCPGTTTTTTTPATTTTTTTITPVA